MCLGVLPQTPLVLNRAGATTLSPQLGRLPNSTSQWSSGALCSRVWKEKRTRINKFADSVPEVTDGKLGIWWTNVRRNFECQINGKTIGKNETSVALEACSSITGNLRCLYIYSNISSRTNEEVAICVGGDGRQRAARASLYLGPLGAEKPHP